MRDKPTENFSSSGKLEPNGPDGLPPVADGTGQPPENEESFWKANGTFFFWIGLIIAIKVFIADIFVIPTGSMEPTLHGRNNAGDRIFCTKVNYLWRTPERWEIFVFKFPHLQASEPDRTSYKGENFIKRCIALPGETVALRRGDVFISRDDGATFVRQVKPPAVQAGLWLPVYAENFTNVQQEDFERFWRVTGWKLANRKLVSSSENRGGGAGGLLTFRPQTRFRELDGIPDRYFRRQYVEFTCTREGCGGKLRKNFNIPMLTARCPRCGAYLMENAVTYYDSRCEYPAYYKASFNASACKLGDDKFRGSYWHLVPDLRLRTRAMLEPGAELELRLFDDRHDCVARFSAGDEVALLVDGKPLPAEILKPDGREPTGGSASGGRLAPETWYDLDFQRVDGTLRIFVNGEPVVISGLFDTGFPEDDEQPKDANVELAVQGGVRLEQLAIDRDVYYFPVGRHFVAGSFTLPSDGYLALGDNQPSSSDSRDWGAVPAKNLVGTAQFTWWPPEAWRLLNLGHSADEP